MELIEITDKVKELIALESELEIAQGHVAKLKDKIRQYKEDYLPNALIDSGLEKVVCDGGLIVSWTKQYNASIPNMEFCAKDPKALKKRLEAFDWLRQNNHGALIKTVLKTSFGSSEMDNVNKEMLARFMKVELDIPFDQQDSVHPMTLKAWVKEQMEAGNKIPVGLFNVHTPNVATVKVAEPKG